MSFEIEYKGKISVYDHCCLEFDKPYINISEKKYVKIQTSNEDPSLYNIDELLEAIMTLMKKEGVVGQYEITPTLSAEMDSAFHGTRRLQ